MKRQNSRGFTLIELMVVVAIVGILAAIAIPQFNNYQLNSKTSEAKTNLGGIKTSAEAFFAAYDRHPPDLNPAGNVGLASTKATWNPAACPVGCDPANPANCTEFTCLGFSPSGSVYYSYTLQEGDTAGLGYAIVAEADLDGDATPSAIGFVSDADQNGLPDVAAPAGGGGTPCPQAAGAPTQQAACVPGEF